MIAHRLRHIAHRFRYLPGLHRLEPVWQAVHPGYDRIVKWIAEREPRTMPGGEDRWRFDGRYHDFPFESIEPHVYQWIAQHVVEGSTFYDVGAFIGYHTLCAAKRVGETGRVFTFEPGPENIEVLQHNIRLNKMQKRVRVFGAAVGDRDDDFVSFYQRREDPTTHSIAYIPEVDHVKKSTLTRVQVPMRSIDSIVDETKQPPSVMKIDVEGAEARVLSGARETLRANRIPIICAIHPDWLPQLGDDVDSLLQLIRSLGYRATDFAGREKTYFGFEEVILLPD